MSLSVHIFLEETTEVAAQLLPGADAEEQPPCGATGRVGEVVALAIVSLGRTPEACCECQKHLFPREAASRLPIHIRDCEKAFCGHIGAVLAI